MDTVSSSQELKAKVDGIKTEVQIARLSIISAMHRMTDSISALQALDSKSPDAHMAISGMNSIENTLLSVTDEMQRTEHDLDNYRQTIG